jgi:predicted small secreted protein
MKVTLVTFCVVAGCVVSAGCGGASGGGSDRLSREELISQADAICAKYEKQFNALAAPQSVEEIEEFAVGAKSIIGKSLTEFRTLEPPEDLEDEYDEWISLTEEGLGRLDELAEAGAHGDADRADALFKESLRAQSKTGPLAREIGFRDCEQ